MHSNLKFIAAEENDLKDIINLLLEDELGQSREELTSETYPLYLKAFHLINKDPNQALMVIKNSSHEVIATCHLTVIANLSYKGTTRFNIENVHVKKELQGQKIGQWMFEKIFELGKQRGAKIFQLTTNKKRSRAKIFYERLGFVASHEGMKRVFID
jgi:ribosomal protein S18 acetylase RimI-like enzyme